MSKVIIVTLIAMLIIALLLVFAVAGIDVIQHLGDVELQYDDDWTGEDEG